MVLAIASYPRTRLLLLLFGAFISFAALASEGERLAICFLEDNMPYSDRASSSGFDYELGMRVAGLLEKEFKPVWISNNTQIQEIESDYPFKRLARGECSVILSVPGTSESFEEDGATIVLGSAYYAAAFELVSNKTQTSRNLRKLRGKEVAIQSQTVAHFALKMLGAKSKTYFSTIAAVDGVARGEAAAGLLWGPTVGWVLQELEGENKPTFVDDYEPPVALRWNVHFVTRSGDESLRKLVTESVATIDAQGELSALMKKYNLPDRRPYDKTYTLGALNELQLAR